tara:strand:- start:1059 stop:2315 length:1257 start_codon:yes stop_codon:yes gene_type:complete
MTIKITTPNGGADSLDFGCAQTAIVATVTGTEVSSGEGKLELKTTTGGTSATKMTIAANGDATFTGDVSIASLNGGQLAGNRNRIINGNMMIDQRNTGAAYTLTGDSQYNVDRFKGRTYGGSGRFSAQQVTDAPDGFLKSLKVTVTTTNTSGTYGYSLEQQLEGLNIIDFNFGSASAKTYTMSFWVKASIAGTYTCANRTLGGGASCVFTYTIDSVNTWEKKTFTFPANTGFTTGTDNGIGLICDFGFGPQTSKLTSTLGAWQSGNYLFNSGQVDLMATSGATFYITGVQLERGSVATPFEHRGYGTELALCQRYYQQYGPHGNTMVGDGVTYNSTTAHRWGFELPVVMRVAPTGVLSGTCGLWNGASIGGSAVLGTNYTKPEMVQYDMTCNSGLINTTGLRMSMYLNTGTFTASAEL